MESSSLAHEKILSRKQSHQGQRIRSLHQLVFTPESVFPYVRLLIAYRRILVDAIDD